MPFELVFDKKALKEMSKLPKEIKERIFSKLIEAKEDPFRFFEGLSGRKEHKLRIGNYRVIAFIDTQRNQIQVLKAGHRKNIYEKL